MPGFCGGRCWFVALESTFLIISSEIFENRVLRSMLMKLLWSPPALDWLARCWFHRSRSAWRSRCLRFLCSWICLWSQAPWNVVRLFLSVIFLDVVEFVFPVLLVPIFRGPPAFGVRVLIVPTALVLPPGSVLLVVHVQPGLGDRVPLVPSDLGLLGGLVPLGSLVPPGGLVPLVHVGFVCLVLGDHAPPATDDFVPPDWVKSS